jgi:GTP-binding protein HflX
MSSGNSQLLNTNEKVIVVGVGLKSDMLVEIKENLCELEELVTSAGGEIVGNIFQILPQWNPATLIGSGKSEEIKQMVAELSATAVIFDHHLSGVQARNLQNLFNVKVIDRNQLILNIFAQRAQTFEGKLQVELAILLDQMPRMVDAWMGSLSRLGGGIGTRGPGESALEIDRRRTRERISQTKKRLESVRKNRAQHRTSRKRQEVPSFAMIGYTNSGKSSLLNRLTGSQVLVKNQVFATLDPTTRKIFLPSGPMAVVTDTVGFIRKLPPQLIEAFKATLEESAEADILIHVIDLSSPSMNRQIEVVDDLIEEFGWNNKPIIHVFNKVDIAPVDRQFKVNRHPRVFVSALTGQGLDQLKTLMSEKIGELQMDAQLYFPRSQEHRIFDLSRETRILKKEAASEGTLCYAQLTTQMASRWRDFLVK